MADVLEILLSSGPMPLDELNLRTAQEPEDLAKSIARLQKTGQVTVKQLTVAGEDPGATANWDDTKTIGELTAEQVRGSSKLVVELPNAAMRRLTR
jgi:hypothetical protein